MTVSAQSPINRSTGNGVTTVFPYTFKIISAADIEVSIDNVVKVLNVDYTVTGEGVDAGGNVTMTTAPANGTSVVRRRNMALTRTTDYQDQGTLPAATLDNDIDNVVLMVQQVDEQIGRALTAPASLAGFNGEIPAPIGSYVLGIKPDGSGFQYYGPSDNALLTAALAAPTGATLVGNVQPGTGAVAETVEDVLNERIRIGAYSTVQNAVTAAAGKTLVGNTGDYSFSADLTGLDSVREFVNEGAQFSNYSIKELFPDSLFKNAEDKLASLFSQRLSTSGNYPTVVITGDSLSYNHQDFDATSRAEADDCYPGMNSWAFLIRDALIRNDPFFKHADEIPYLLGTGPSSLGTNGSAQYINPFNGRMQAFRATAQTQEIKFYYKHMGPQTKVYAWFLKNPTDTGCSFNVKVGAATQVTAWDTGGTTAASPYQGMELHFVEIPNVPNTGLWQTLTLTEFIGTASVPHATNRDVYFCGISSSLVNVKLTGKGSQSSKWLADNLAAQVTTYAPDLSIIIIGANDGWAGNPQGLQTVANYQTNLNTIIDGIRTTKSTAQVLLISPPLSTGAVVPNATMKRYIAKAREVAYLKGCAFIDLEDFFASTPTTVYRFDSIHFSKQGNEMLARKVASMVLPSADLAPGYLEPTFSAGLYPYTTATFPAERAYANWTGAAFTLTKLVGDGNLVPVVSVEKHNDYTIKVNFSISQGLISKISVAQFDANGLQQITASPQNYFDGYALFQLRKQDGSQLVLADWTTYSTSLKFIIEVA